MTCTEAQLAAAKKYRLAHKEEMAERGKKYRAANKEKKQAYNKKHKDRISETSRIWRLRNTEKRKKYMLDWREKNAAHVKEYDAQKRKEDDFAEKKKRWDKTYYDAHSRVIMEHVYARRQKFGYNKLNKKFPGSVGHHIDNEFVIFIPEELHKSIPHSQGDAESMYKINIKAREVLL